MYYKLLLKHLLDMKLNKKKKHMLKPQPLK